ncbi:MAG: hypothetical protein IJS54_06780 [Desulfovibrio sp.]|nr:hypothetical protein [Desulfovibrio sp.]
MSITTNFKAAKIRAPNTPAFAQASEAESTIQTLDCYLTVLEDNKKAACFIPDDAAMALDLACFVCDRYQGRTERTSMPAMRLSMALLKPTQAIVQ